MRTFQIVPIIVFVIILLIGCENKKRTEQLSLMPISITNNAVCGITLNGKEYVYSFGGLLSGKTHSDITLRSFCLDVQSNIWSEIAPLPDTMGKIASAASVVKNKIYIIGGYYVFPDGHEKSSAKVHVYDPISQKYLADAADISTPIDDQVQAVWRDSLIYVVSGWYDHSNVRMVQVYEPEDDVWHYATPLPEDYSYAVFGSSGVIADDIIYYMGGAGNRNNKNFPIQSYLRFGQINPSNPLEINWSTVQLPEAGIYRPAALNINGKAAWINGAAKSYNYNGIAYTGSKVNPLSQVLVYDISSQSIKVDTIDIPKVMDLRGVASFKDKFIIAGGMEPNQKVSNKAQIVYIDK